MAGRGRAGRSGRGLIDDSAEPLMGGGLHTARRVPGFKNPFDDPGGMTPVADNHSIQGAGVGSPGAGVPSHDTLGRRSLGCAVMTGYALPAFSLRGVQAFAATHAVTRVYSGGDIVDHGRRDAGYVTMAAFGSLIVASYAQLIAAHFGDGLRTRLGRRRPVLAFLAPLNAVAAYLLVSPPEALEGNSAFYAIVFGLLMVFVEIATTMLDALGTEMSALQHPDARTTLFAAQTTAGIVGVGCASAAGLVIGFKPGDGIAAGMPRALVGIAIAVLLLLTHAVAVLTTHETPSSALPSKQFRRMRTSFVPGLRWIMRNSQWKIFMWATTPLNLIAELMAIVPAVYVYLLQCGEDEEMYERDDYQKGGCEQGEALRWASSAMIVYACGAAVSAGLLAPLLARRFNKLVTLRGFVLLAFFFSFFGLFAADKDNSRGVFLAFTALLGLAWGGIQSLKPALLSDVVDYGELICGARQEGTYQAISKLIHLWFTFLGRAFPIAVLSAACTEEPANGSANTAHHPAMAVVSQSDLDHTRWKLRLGFLGCLPAACTLIAAVWLSWFQLQDVTTAEKIQRFLAQRRESGDTNNLYDPISHTPISAFTHAAPSPAKNKNRRRGGRRGFGRGRGSGGGTTPLAEAEAEAAAEAEEDADETSEDLEAQKRRASNYMLYFSHGDLTLISRYGTAKFLGLFGLQLTLWLIYAVVLVADAVVLVDKALRDLDSAPEIWADNYTSIGVFDPELNPEQGRLAWSLIIVFTASVFVFITAYNLARSHAAYWLTMQPRREEFKQIVDARMLEREAEWTGILAWVAQKNSGKGAVLVHVIIATAIASISVGIYTRAWDGICHPA